VTRRPRVLIADDDADIRALIQAMLAGAGVTSAAVANGTTALQHARSDPAELYVLDVQMPDITGVELCRQLKTEHPAGGRVLMVSAQASATAIAAAHAAGCDAYLAKPFTRAALLEKVNALLDDDIEPHATT